MSKKRTLIYDVETSPFISTGFSLYPTSIPHSNVLQDWYIICICWKWAGEKKVHVAKTYNSNDKAVIKKFVKALEKADEVVGHNIKKFDNKKVKHRALMNGLPPVVFPRCVDTLTQVRKHAAFTSNRLDYVSKQMGFEGKKGATGDLWVTIASEVFKGKKPIRAVDAMAKYCANDIKINEEVYNILKPYIDIGHNLAIYGDNVCPCCGSHNLIKYGTYTTATSIYQQHRCKDCLKVFRSSEKLNKKTRVNR